MNLRNSFFRMLVLLFFRQIAARAKNVPLFVQYNGQDIEAHSFTDSKTKQSLKAHRNRHNPIFHRLILFTCVFSVGHCVTIFDAKVNIVNMWIIQSGIT